MSGAIGFMQGRLCDQVDGRIQAFPWRDWQLEFALASRHSFGLMEWTLDQDRLNENPLMTPTGRAQIAALCETNGVQVRSLTGDCFMQAPFYKADGAQRQARIVDLENILTACADIGVRYVVVPLVDAGALETPEQETVLKSTLLSLVPRLRAYKMAIVFESDLGPAALARFIGDFPADVFGINYDIGNSASLGHDPTEEIGAYGNRILNVHIKDRVRGGTTVPLGTGNADFTAVFRALRRAEYRGDFILQTARAADGDHAGALCRYRDMARAWLWEHGS
jgi:hexulose-6-phosphate isomerase